MFVSTTQTWQWCCCAPPEDGSALRQLFGLSEAEVRKLVLTLPPVLGLSVDENVRPKLAFLQAELRLSDAELRAEVLRQPKILSTSLERSLRPTVALFHRERTGEGATAASLYASAPM